MHSVYLGTECLSFLGPRIWNQVTVELKKSESLGSCKLKKGSRYPLNIHADYVKLGCNKQDFFPGVWSLTPNAIFIFIIYVIAVIFMVVIFF